MKACWLSIRNHQVQGVISAGGSHCEALEPLTGMVGRGKEFLGSLEGMTSSEILGRMEKVHSFFSHPPVTKSYCVLCSEHKSELLTQKSVEPKCLPFVHI